MDDTPYETKHVDKTQPYIRVGSRIRAEWLQANPMAALAGMQMKMSAKAKSIEGIVTAIHGDHPTQPMKVWVKVKPDDGPEVEIDVAWIRQVLSDPG